MRTLLAGRKSGKTTAVAMMALAEPRALVVCATHRDAERLHREFGVPRSQVMAATYLEGGRDAQGYVPSAVIVDDVDRLSDRAKYGVSWLARKAPTFATASYAGDVVMDVDQGLDELSKDVTITVDGTVLSPRAVPPIADGREMQKLLRWLSGQLEARGIGNVSELEWWQDPTRRGLWMQLSIRFDTGENYGVRQAVTEERLVRATDWRVEVMEACRQVVKLVDRKLKFTSVDPVRVAIDVVGFERSEIKAARLVPGDTMKTCTLEVDLHDTEWEPDFELDMDEVLPGARFDLEQWIDEDVWAHAMRSFGVSRRPSSILPLTEWADPPDLTTRRVGPTWSGQYSDHVHVGVDFGASWPRHGVVNVVD